MLSKLFKRLILKREVKISRSRKSKKHELAIKKNFNDLYHHILLIFLSLTPSTIRDTSIDTSCIIDSIISILIDEDVKNVATESIR